MCQTCSRMNFGISVPLPAIYAIILYGCNMQEHLDRTQGVAFPGSNQIQGLSNRHHSSRTAIQLTHLAEHLARAQEGPPEMLFVH